MLTKDRINRLSEWLKANLADKTTILLLAAVIIMMYAPVWGGYLLFALLGWRWCFCVACTTWTTDGFWFWHAVT